MSMYGTGRAKSWTQSFSALRFGKEKKVILIFSVSMYGTGRAKSWTQSFPALRFEKKKK